jgi:hypothetical protein
LTLAADARRTLFGLAIDTSAGGTELTWTGLFGTLWFDPMRGSGYHAAGGITWGPVWLRSDAKANPEYIGRSDTSTTSVASLVLRTGYRWGAWCLDLTFEPGIMLPKVRVLAGELEVRNLGRLWLSSFAVLTWEA